MSWCWARCLDPAGSWQPVDVIEGKVYTIGWGIPENVAGWELGPRIELPHRLREPAPKASSAPAKGAR